MRRPLRTPTNINEILRGTGGGRLFRSRLASRRLPIPAAHSTMPFYYCGIRFIRFLLKIDTLASSSTESSVEGRVLLQYYRFALVAREVWSAQLSPCRFVLGAKNHRFFAREIRVRDPTFKLSVGLNELTQTVTFSVPARPKGLRDELPDQLGRIRVRWTALGELESMCRLVVLETAVFVPKTADQTGALSAEAEWSEEKPLCASV